MAKLSPARPFQPPARRVAKRVVSEGEFSKPKQAPELSGLLEEYAVFSPTRRAVRLAREIPLSASKV
jgi:hypothetical protein